MSLVVDIRKRLGAFALDVRFEGENEVLALLGASGCGKSMTLKCIAGIETPDEGTILLDGRTLFDAKRRINLSPQKRRVGYLFQQYALFPNMTVWQNIACGVRDKQAREEKVRGLVASMYLAGEEHKYPAQLSGGQQQRVALARILANEPEILMLDEPFSALDSYLQWQLELELSDTLQRYNKTTLFVSHSRDEVYRLCDRVCVMEEGRSMPPVLVKALFDNPRTVSAALLSGCKNFSRITRLDAHRVLALDWQAELACAEPVPEGARYIGVRAHNIHPAAQGEANTIPCGVARVVEDVFSTVVMLAPVQGEATAYGSIRMEVDKASFAALPGEGRLDVAMDPQHIMVLE